MSRLAMAATTEAPAKPLATDANGASSSSKVATLPTTGSWAREFGVDALGHVYAMARLGDDLYVTGSFETAGVLLLASPPQPGFSASNLAAWRFATGGRWSTPGGTDEPVMALSTPDDATLVVGGWFGSAGPIAASGVAAYDPATASRSGARPLARARLLANPLPSKRRHPAGS